MNIGFIANDTKKELMTAFCIAYKGILEQHNLFATNTTGSIIEEGTGLKVNKFSHGVLGQQQMEARAVYNEIDLIIFFEDLANEFKNGDNLINLLKACDANNIPIATNIATAEVLINGLMRGDLMWRENVYK